MRISFQNYKQKILLGRLVLNLHVNLEGTDFLSFGDIVMIEQIKLKFCGVSIIERKAKHEMNK